MFPGKEADKQTAVSQEYVTTITQQLMRKLESCWKESCAIAPTGTRVIMVLLACFTTTCFTLPNSRGALNIKFTTTLNVAQLIYLYKLISISLLLKYWEAPLIVLTSYLPQSTMLLLCIFPLQHKIYQDIHTLWIPQNFYLFQ